MRMNSEVIEVGEMTKLENSDMLSVTQILGGYPVVMNTAQWEETFSKQGNRKALYIFPEAILPPELPGFEFLGDKPKNRIIRIKKIRGVMSYGLLTPLPEGDWEVGSSFDTLWNIGHYQPEESEQGNSDSSPGPKGIHLNKYDISDLRKYKYLFAQGEPVIVTEKIHGENFCAVYSSQDEQVFIKSRNRWVLDDGINNFSRAFRSNPEIEAFVRAYPDHVLFGEAYGKVKGFHYGLKPDTVNFAAFDIFHNGQFLNYHEARELSSAYKFDWAPEVISDFLFDFDTLVGKIEEDSVLAKSRGQDQVCEGVVVKPLKERFHNRAGRVCLKIVSQRYYSH